VQRPDKRQRSSADRIVCRGRAGERVTPARASVSDSRQPTERDIEAAAVGGPATSQGGVRIRIASSRSHRQSWPAHCLFASLAWRALCLLADAPTLPGWDTVARCHWTQLRRDPRPLPQKAGQRRPQAKTPGASGAHALVALGHLPDAPLLHARSGGKLTGPQDCEAAPHAWWRRAGLQVLNPRSTVRPTSAFSDSCLADSPFMRGCRHSCPPSHLLAPASRGPYSSKLDTEAMTGQQHCRKRRLISTASARYSRSCSVSV
jgi:hypothetical protein